MAECIKEGRGTEMLQVQQEKKTGKHEKVDNTAYCEWLHVRMTLRIMH
jgi:hypothetical protein